MAYQRPRQTAPSAQPRAPDLGPLDVIVGMPLAVGEDVRRPCQLGRDQMALYLGGMKARGRNFYNGLACRYGCEREAAEVQDVYLAGHKSYAAAAVSADLLEGTSLIGAGSYVTEKFAALASAGATALNLHHVEPTDEARLHSIETIRELMP